MSLVERATDLAALLREFIGTPELLKRDTRAEVNELIAEIDQLLRDLHQVRGLLVTAVRRYDDALNRQIDESLRRRQGRQR